MAPALASGQTDVPCGALHGGDELVDVDAQQSALGERHAQLATERAQQRISRAARGGDLDHHVAASLDGGVTKHGLRRSADVEPFELAADVVGGACSAGVDAQLPASVRAVVDLELGDVG